jgi:hypothetical protein
MKKRESINRNYYPKINNLIFIERAFTLNGNIIYINIVPLQGTDTPIMLFSTNI